MLTYKALPVLFKDACHQPLLRAWYRFRFAHRQTPKDSVLRELLLSQWWSHDRLRSHQWQRLRSLLRFAYSAVPYYRELFLQIGAVPDDIRTEADYRRLPVLTKQIVQDRRTDLHATSFSGNTIENSTGGSTGHPVTIRQDADYHLRGIADIDRCYSMCGYHVGDRQAFLWGSDRDGMEHRGFRGRARDLIRKNLVWVNTFGLDQGELARWGRFLAWFRPQFIVAYVSSAALLARLVRERGIDGIRPNAIQTSAEVLDPANRSLVQDAFGCPIFDRYGCREVGNIAHECSEHRGLHVLAENNYLELLDRSGAPVGVDELGLVTVTNLNNRAMPLIRYQNGDLAQPMRSGCPCGRNSPMIGKVTGRVSDIITSPSGRLIHGEFFTHLFYSIRGIRQFQVYQRSIDQLLIRIVPMGTLSPETATTLATRIRNEADPGFSVDVRLCERIDSSPSGKYRFTLSDVPVSLKR